MDGTSLSRRSRLTIYAKQVTSAVSGVVPVAYLLGILFQLDERQIVEVSVRWAPPVFVTLGFIGPMVFIHVMLERGLRQSPGEAPGARLRRLLLLPRQIGLGVTALAVLAITVFSAVVCLTCGRSLLLLLPAALVAAAVVLLLEVRYTMKIEEVLRPLAMEEMERHPEVRLGGSGFLWPRQVWYRPYVTLLVLLATLVALGVIVARRLHAFLAHLGEELRQRGHAQLAAELPEWGQQFLGSLLTPSAIIVGFLLFLGIITALSVSRRQRQGVQAVEAAARAMASGAYQLPAWPATDELGDLAFATAGAVASLKRKAFTVASSARTLEDVARELTELVARQRGVLDTQASVLQQTQATAQEIKQTSELASEKAGKVLAAAESAEQVGQSGRAAVESSLDQLRDILSQVQQMAGQVKRLDERTRQIGRITMVVKDLADQSNMVALNAAIEATRAGESGKTFSVVAQQIRRLGDESMAATDQVQRVLEDVEGAIRQAVRLSGAGIDRAGSGLQLTQACGEDIRRLSEIVEGNASAARQISAAVTQQGAGISQIFEALELLGNTMGETVASMKATEAITERARRAAQEVAAAMAGSPLVA